MYCILHRLGEEWEDPVHSGMLSESRELLPDEEDDEEENGKEIKDGELIKGEKDESHKGK